MRLPQLDNAHREALLFIAASAVVGVLLGGVVDLVMRWREA